MKVHLLLILFFLLTGKAYSVSNGDSILSVLNQTLANKPKYANEKEERIEKLKSQHQGAFTPIQAYQFNENLVNEYKRYKLDSAIFYELKNLVLSNIINNQEFRNNSKLQLATLYSSSGKYRESETILKGIKKEQLSKVQLADYDEAHFRFFEHYATNSFNESYAMEIDNFRDSLLSVLDSSTLRYKINLAQKYIITNDLAFAEKKLLPLINITKPEQPEYAMVTYLLGSIYGKLNNRELEKKYFTLSAIADLKNAVKDQASVQLLSSIYFNEGNIDEAYKLVKSAIDDAIFCGVQFRTTQLSSFYTIINGAYQDKETKRKEQLKVYLTAISLLSVFLVMAIFYVYKQMQKVSRIKEELFKTNEKLASLNKEISKTNERLNLSNAELSESNHIKEEYIAHFFDLCSAYINKLENFRKELNKKVSDKKLDELSKMLKSTTIVDNELDELYNNFDHIFLNLYPTFVKDFNTLLIPDEQIVLKTGELLNTELRIFALIRLGITDSVKIAAFLRYSLSTIYNYRTKARNKAAVSRDDFENMVMKIGSLSEKLNN